MLVDRWGGADGLVGSINSISSLLTMKSLNPLGNTQETLKRPAENVRLGSPQEN